MQSLVWLIRHPEDPPCFRPQIVGLAAEAEVEGSVKVFK